MSVDVYPVGAEDFRQRVLEESARRPVLVDFWAAWCAPCKALMPLLEKLAGEYAGAFALAKANADEQQELAGRYAVRSLPTVLVFRHGEPVDGFAGVQTESVLRELIERHRVHEADRLLATALEAEQQGRAKEALALLEQAHAAEPERLMVRIELARRLARGGDAARARQLLAELPVADRETEVARQLEAELNLLDALAQAPPADVLAARLEQQPEDAEAAYLLALCRYAAGDAQAAVDGLLDVVMRHRKHAEEARRRLLEIFALRADDDPLVKAARRRLAMAMH